MAKAPAFQFYASDFLASTVDMTNTEVGAYVRALCNSWNRGPLPKDEAKLARLMLAPPKEFSQVWPAVKERLTDTPDGYINDRLEIERAKQAIYREKQALKGRASAQQRFNRGSTAVTGSVEPEHQPEHSKRLQPEGNSPSPVSDLQSLKEKAKTPRKRVERPAMLGFDEFWSAYPLKRGKNAAIKAWNKLQADYPLQQRITAALAWQAPTLVFERDGELCGTHPATWLNGHRWLDERPVVRPRGLPAPQPDYESDWYEECGRLHSHGCGSKYKHSMKMAVAS